MRIDDIAQRYARRKDFELVDFSLVALPMYAITMECICCVHRPFPPMMLFALRAVNSGLNTESKIASFLGLELNVTQTTLNELVRDHYLTDDTAPGVYALTEIGSRLIEDEKVFVPQEETHTVIFDGILRRPVWISGERLMRPSEIDRISTIEIRPYPGIAPELDELKLPDVVSVLKSRYGGEEEFDRDVLALSRITRRSKVFRIAAGLAYKLKRGSDVQVSFIVDGVPHKDMEQVFAEKGGARKMGFIKALSETGIERSIRRHLGNDVVQLLPDEEDLQSCKQILAGARFGLEIATRKAEREPNAPNSELLEEARKRFSEANRNFQTFEARPLDVYESVGLWEDALASAHKRILVGVTEYWDAAIDKNFLKLLEANLARGLDIRIVEFLRTAEDVPPRKKREGLAELGRLSNKYHSLRVSQSRRRGFFFLIKDSQFAAVANRPFFGPSSRTRMFHQFSGYLLQSPALVDAYVSRISDIYWTTGSKEDKGDQG